MAMKRSGGATIRSRVTSTCPAGGSGGGGGRHCEAALAAEASAICCLGRGQAANACGAAALSTWCRNKPGRKEAAQPLCCSV